MYGEASFFLTTAEQEIITFTSSEFNKNLLQDSSFDIQIIKELYPYVFCANYKIKRKYNLN